MARNDDARRGDVGPRDVLNRGERVMSSTADIARPGVRGATVRVSVAYWLPNEMHSRGSLSRELLAVATRYRDDVEIAGGGSPGGHGDGLRVDGGGGHCATQVALDAIARVRRVQASLQVPGLIAVGLAVVGNANRRTLAAALGMGESAAAGYLVAQIELMARGYDFA